MDLLKIYAKLESGDSLTNKELQMLNDSFVKLSNLVPILGITAKPYNRFIYGIETSTSGYRRARNMALSEYCSRDFELEHLTHNRITYQKIFDAVNVPNVKIDDALGQFTLVDVNKLIYILDTIEVEIEKYELLFAPLIAYVAASKAKLVQYTSIDVKVS